MGLQYFYDLRGPPSRAICMFLQYSKIQFEPFPVDTFKGEHKTDRFMDDFSRFQMVPFIHDGMFRLNESVAILRYLADKYQIDNQWYPKDLIKRGSIDEYLEWQHANIHETITAYLQLALQQRKGSDTQKLQNTENAVLASIEAFERLFLENREFIASEDVPSIADIFAISQFEQLRVAGFDFDEKAPGLVEWMERVKGAAGPLYQQIFSDLYKFVDRMAKRRSKL